MTLTEAARFTRQSVYIIGIPFVGIIIFWMLFQTFRNPAGLPEKYIEPDYLCGQLDEVTLNSLAHKTSGATFSIETTSTASNPRAIG